MLLGYISPLGISTRIYVSWLLCFCIHWWRCWVALTILVILYYTHLGLECY